MVREQVGHQPGQRENRNGDAQQHGQQESAVDMPPEFFQPQRAEQPQGGGVNAFDRLDQFFVDARNEGDRAARNSGNDVGHAHGAALERK